MLFTGARTIPRVPDQRQTRMNMGKSNSLLGFGFFILILLLKNSILEQSSLEFFLFSKIALGVQGGTEKEREVILYIGISHCHKMKVRGFGELNMGHVFQNLDSISHPHYMKHSSDTLCFFRLAKISHFTPLRRKKMRK